MQTRDVHVYVFDSLSDWEVGHAIAYINSPEYQREPGSYRVRSVGDSRSPARTAGGLTIVPDLALSELDPKHSAMLILPGGARWDRGENADALDKAKQFHLADVPIAAICGATAGLARAGLLDDCAHTSNAREYLEHVPGYRGAENYREARAVSQRGIITAGSTAPVDFARAIFETLELYSKPVLEAWYGLFSTGESRYFYELMQAAGPPA